MRVRPIDWRDLPALYRFRRHSAFLDSALLLTRGPLLLPGALLSYLVPSMGIYTSVGRNGGDNSASVFGQIIHLPGSQLAHLTFLTPDSELESERISGLLDHFAVIASERGAFRMLADVDERTQAYEALRRSNFAIYTRQRIWKLDQLPSRLNNHSGWRPATDRDLISIRSLYNNLVPGLVQQVEPFGSQNTRGHLFCEGGELVAYVEVKYGHRGIWVQPFVHPDAEDFGEWFTDFFHNLPYRRSRPVYLCIRSYQSWLEPTIEDLGAEAGPRQAVMVKHLAVPQKSVRVFALPALEGGHPEVSAPIARTGVSKIIWNSRK